MVVIDGTVVAHTVTVESAAITEARVVAAAPLEGLLSQDQKYQEEHGKADTKTPRLPRTLKTLRRMLATQKMGGKE